MVVFSSFFVFFFFLVGCEVLGEGACRPCAESALRIQKQTGYEQHNPNCTQVLSSLNGATIHA